MDARDDEGVQGCTVADLAQFRCPAGKAALKLLGRLAGDDVGKEEVLDLPAQLCEIRGGKVAPCKEQNELLTGCAAQVAQVAEVEVDRAISVLAPNEMRIGESRLAESVYKANGLILIPTQI